MNNTIDPTDLDRAKRSIRKLIGEIARLTKSDVEPNDFFAKFLDHTVRALSANGGAFWVVDEGNVLQLSHQINLHAAVGYLDDTAEQQHRQLLLATVNSQLPGSVPPHSGATDNSPGNPTDRLILLQPIVVDERCSGVVEIFHEPATKTTTCDGYQEFLSRTADLAADYFRNRKLQSLSAQETRWQQLEAFSNAVHSSLNPKTVAYTIVNDARPVIGCDRLSVALLHKGKARIETVSGQEVINHRSNLIRNLTELVAGVIKSGEPFSWNDESTSTPPTDSSHQADSPETNLGAITDYTSESGCSRLQIVPLFDSSQNHRSQNHRLAGANAIGALIVEYFKESANNSSELTTTIARQSESALSNARRHDSIFLLPLWHWLGDRASRRRFSLRAIAALILIAAITYMLLVVPAEFRVEGKGALLPETRRDVFAEETGVIRNVLVKHGQQVTAGDTIIEMENIDLAVRLQQAKARLVQTADELEIKEAQRDARILNETDTIQLAGEIMSLSSLRDSLTREITLLQQRIDKLTVCSPIDGVVTTWNPYEKLTARPVNNGNRLLNVADDSRGWILEVKLPEDRSGHVLQAHKSGQPLHVEYILATEPETRFRGQVKTIAARAETTEEDGSYVMLVIELDADEQPPLRPGAEVRAHISCGERCLGYVWFHELIDFVHSRVLF